MTDEIVRLEDLVRAQTVMIKSIIHLLDTRFSEPKFSDVLHASLEKLAESGSKIVEPSYLRALHSILPPQAS